MATLRSEMIDSGGVREIRGPLRDETKVLAQVTAIAAHQDREFTATQEQLRRTMTMIDPTCKTATDRCRC
ncbi:MAG: hypothetical protein ACO1Q7_20380 [Gemmatimonas sp.]